MCDMWVTASLAVGGDGLQTAAEPRPAAGQKLDGHLEGWGGNHCLQSVLSCDAGYQNMIV